MKVAAAAAFFVLGFFAWTGASSAEPTVVDVSEQPIVIVQHAGPVTVTTWDRPQVSVETSGEQPPMVERRVQRRLPGAGGMDMSYAVPIPPIAMPGPDGMPMQLGPEEFPIQAPSGPHDTVHVQVPAGVSSVMVPASTAVLAINGAGNTAIENYHGQLIAQQRSGPMLLRNMTGDAFVQNLRGPIYITDSNFNRLRARTLVNNMIFQRCNVKQIEATSVRGSIVYNDGSFQPGLARFETTMGHVALGVNGGASIAVRGQPGQIFQSFDRPTQFIDRNGEANAVVGGGGPLVNVVTRGGKVFLYDGSLTAKRGLGAHWNQARATLEGRHDTPAPPPPPRIPTLRLPRFR